MCSAIGLGSHSRASICAPRFPLDELSNKDLLALAVGNVDLRVSTLWLKFVELFERSKVIEDLGEKFETPKLGSNPREEFSS